MTPEKRRPSAPFPRRRRRATPEARPDAGLARVVASALVLLLFASAACSGKGGLSFKREAAPAPLDAAVLDACTVDFRYAPAAWQSTIGLPDDALKTLLSDDGTLLYDYRGGETPGFATRISVAVRDFRPARTVQAMPDARVPVVETALLDAEGRERCSWKAMAVVPGDDQELPGFLPRDIAAGAPRPRGDLLVVRKPGAEGAIEIRVEAEGQFTFKRRDLGLYRDGRRFLSASAPWELFVPSANEAVLVFPPSVEQLAVYVAHGYDAGDVDTGWAAVQERRAAAYWHALPLPYNVIRVADPDVQDLIDASIRNIYQSREVKEGLPVFQVGPTCYRGLWVVDGCFILEAMTFLGRSGEARMGIRHLLTRQKPDGSFEILDKYWKENGIVLYLLYRHALLTRDVAWLRRNWETVRRVVEVIRRLRRESRANPNAPEAGLMPAGFPDGGIGGVVPEYTNVYWNLAGLKAAVEAARLVGAAELEDWEAEYEDFLETFRRAAKRDSRPIDGKMSYLPILMRPDPAVAPVRGQWAFCHAVYPGKLFDVRDPLALGTMALLERSEAEGLVLGTGWMPDGIWNYFASFYGHAQLWLGRGEKAARILYAFANHASPLRAWREEQPPRGKDTERRFVGDMPHNWASAEFIRLVRNLVVLERGRELHLLEGIPRTWLAAGATTELKGVATDFGPVSLLLRVDDDGRHATLRVEKPPGADMKRIVIHLGAWAGAAKPEVTAEDGLIEAVLPLVR
ncbi:MAG: hypothetical protein JW742_00370 [Candidatus Aminicenantes bacterium]|nr:hypothetical protein [Candidatus Aminicenantes bacterium]